MSRSFEEAPTLQNVVPGGRVTLNLPLGLTYDQVIFELTNVSPADMKNLKVITGSKAQWDVTDGARIADVNTFYKRPEKSGFLTLWFYRPEMRTEEERALTSIGTLDIPSLTIQFDLDSGVSNPAIKAYTVRRAPQPLGVITKFREYPTTFATAGRQDIDNIPRGARIQAMHLFKSDVDHVEFEVNSGSGAGKIVDWPKTMLEAVQEQYGRAPLSAKATHIEMNLLGKATQWMPTQKLVDMRIKPTLGSAGALTTLVEYIDGYHGI